MIDGLLAFLEVPTVGHTSLFVQRAGGKDAPIKLFIKAFASRGRRLGNHVWRLASVRAMSNRFCKNGFTNILSQAPFLPLFLIGRPGSPA